LSPAYIFTVVVLLLLDWNHRTPTGPSIEPMYILLCNLSLHDLIGITALVSQITLSVIGIRRYSAICHPLRYHSIMSKSHSD
ncbi:hypothetical protein NFI96_024602, partial [Prochilodus magdalenae]